MPYANYTPDEIQKRAERIYEEQIRADVEADNAGRFVVIDIETGDYEMDDDDLDATKRILARHPEAVLFGMRIGYPAAYTLGAHLTKEQG